MAVRKFKPTTPGQRHKIIGTFEEITASVPENLSFTVSASQRRNNTGKMTMRYLGVATRESSASSTLSVRKMVYPQL